MRIASSQVIPAISDVPSTNPLEIGSEEDNTLKIQNRSALTITDLLNPIVPTSPIQSPDNESDSENSQSELNFTLDKW